MTIFGVLIGDTVGGTLGVIAVGVLAGGIGVVVGGTDGAGGGVEIAAAGARGGLVAISFVELPSEMTVYTFQVYRILVVVCFLNLNRSYNPPSSPFKCTFIFVLQVQYIFLFKIS